MTFSISQRHHIILRYFGINLTVATVTVNGTVRRSSKLLLEEFKAAGIFSSSRFLYKSI